MNQIRAVKRGEALREGVVRFSVGRRGSGTGAGCVALHALANPFKVKPYGPYERREALLRYRAYLQKKIAVKDADVCGALNTVWFAAKRGEVELECFCKPLPCHADVISEIVAAAMN